MQSAKVILISIGLLFLPGTTEAGGSEVVIPVDAPTTAIVDNNAANGDTVATVAATTTNSGLTITISAVTNSGTTYFAINDTTGVITVTSAGATALAIALASATFVITVSANDNGGEPALTHDVTISVNISPTFTGSPFNFAIDDASTQGSSVGTVVVTDGDSDGMTYTLTGTGNTDFSIADKAITVASGVTIDMSTTVSYTLKAEVNDGRLTSTADVTINVSSGATTLFPVFLIVMIVFFVNIFKII